jgi:RHS repeat-associated protein
VYHDDGRLTPKEDGGWQHEYVLRDHLGNTRVMFADMDNDQAVDASEILQQNHYYPFGMNQEGAWDAPTNTTENRYQYNGKELNSDFGLNWYAYGFRYYDPVICRFTGVDPIADQFAELSVYNYASNRPIGAIDLHGLQAYDVNQEGFIEATANVYYNQNNGGINYMLNNADEGEKSTVQMVKELLGPQSFEIDGKTWTISFTVNFVPVDSDEKIVESVANDPTGASFGLLRDSQGKNYYSDAAKTLIITSERGDGTTVAHELLHGFGLPHSGLVEGSPYFGKGDGSGTSELSLANTVTPVGSFGPLSSYDMKRELKGYEVSYLAKHILSVANGQNGKFTNYRTGSSFKTQYGLMSQQTYGSYLIYRTPEIKENFSKIKSW